MTEFAVGVAVVLMLLLVVRLWRGLRGLLVVMRWLAAIFIVAIIVWLILRGHRP